jgi:Terminase small subunit
MTRDARPATELGPRQERVVEEYLIDVNATQAAIRAGYSARTAEVQGSRLSNAKGSDSWRRLVERHPVH